MSKNVTDPFSTDSESQQQKKIFVATFSMLSKLASADGKVSKGEVQIIDRFMKNVLGLDAERRAFAIDVFNKTRRQDTTFEVYARQYRELLADKPKMLEWMLDVLLRISCADESFSDPEHEILKCACDVFGIGEARYKEMKSKYVKGASLDEPTPEDNASPLVSEASAAKNTSSSNSNLQSSYQVLGLSADATDEQIIERHKKLSFEYGPSRIIEFGLPQEFVDLAETKFGEIQQAFKALKAERKF